jgi:hypothetical protein
VLFIGLCVFACVLFCNDSLHSEIHCQKDRETAFPKPANLIGPHNTAPPLLGPVPLGSWPRGCCGLLAPPKLCCGASSLAFWNWNERTDGGVAERPGLNGLGVSGWAKLALGGNITEEATAAHRPLEMETVSRRQSAATRAWSSIGGVEIFA